MAKRNAILGDTGRIDIMMQIDALSPSGRESGFAAIVDAAQASQGVALVCYQDAAASMVRGAPTPIEPFGFTDGFSQPGLVGGQAADLPGDGKIGRGGRWEAIKIGASLVYRKLEQDVRSFRAYIAEWGRRYSGGPEEHMANFVGRWRDGAPRTLSPDSKDSSIVADGRHNNNFTCRDDPDGLKCPIGAHIRRVNRCDPLGFDRQFEFARRQWINYGKVSSLGQDRDPVSGDNEGEGRFVIPGDRRKPEKPFVCSRLPSFVTLKGDGYVFAPRLMPLRLLAAGLIDPR